MVDYFKEIGYDPVNPILEEFQEGGKPTPSHDYFEEIGYDPGLPADVDQVQRESADEGIWDATKKQWKEGTKQVVSTLGWSALAHSKFINRLKNKFPGYNENIASTVFVEGMTSLIPIAQLALPENKEETLQALLESEYLKADPNAQPENYYEDLMRMGPQIGSQILTNLIPFAGPALGAVNIGMQIMGGTYKDLIDQGVPEDTAYFYSLANAALQAPLEQIPFRRMAELIKPQRELIERLRDIGVVAGSEWATEWLQAYPDSFINIFATNPDKGLLERAKMFTDQLWETTKQGAYEGAVAAPWALLGAGGANMAGRAYQKLKGQEPDVDVEEDDLPPVDAVPELFFPEPSMQSPPPLPVIPDDRPGSGGGMRQAPTRASSSVTSRHLEMMNEEQQQAYYDKTFDEQFAERMERSQEAYADRENRKKDALEAADRAAKTKHALAYIEGEIDEITMKEKTGDPIDPYDYVTTWEDRVGAVHKRIQNGLNLIAHQDIYDPGSVALSEEEYNRRAKLLGNLSDIYDIDRNQIPPDLRGAIGIMVEQVGHGEPKQSTYLNEEGDPDLQEGELQTALSTYPDWFKTPFKIQYVVKEKGKLKTKTADYKYGLNRKDFMHIIGKLETGNELTSKESAVADHILQMAMAVKDTDPDLTHQYDVDMMQEDGYEIIGGDRNFGSFNLADQVVLEKGDGRWDTYTVVSEDDGTGNMVLDSLTDRMYANPVDVAKTVGHKNNGYWEALWEMGGQEAMANADPFLPGYGDIKPMEVAASEVDTVALEQNFEAIALPKDARPFGYSPIVSGNKHADRRKKKKRVGLERRKEERRKDWVTRGEIDGMSAEDQITAIKALRKMAMEDLLTGLNNRNEWNRHAEMLGTDIPHIFIDLDGFKWINDHTKAGTLPDGRKVPGGHPMGDQVLGLFGEMMRQTADITGAKDRVRLFRYGGDEFSVLPAERDSMSLNDMRKFEDALREVSSQIMVDVLGKDGKYYQLDGLPYTSASGGTIDAAIANSEKKKKDAPARYTFDEAGKVGAKEPPTLREKRDEPGRRVAGLPGVREPKRLPAPEGYLKAGRALEAPKAKKAPAKKAKVGPKWEDVTDEASLQRVGDQIVKRMGIETPHIFNAVPAGRGFKGRYYPSEARIDLVIESFPSQQAIRGAIAHELLHSFPEHQYMPQWFMEEGQDTIKIRDLQDLTEQEFNKIMPYLKRAKKHPKDFYARLKDVVDKFIEGEPAKGPVRGVAVTEPVGVMAPMAIPTKPKRTPKRVVNFVRENLSILEGNDAAMVNVTYRDPATGEMTKVPENAMEAFNDIENVSDMLYKFRECIRT